MTHREIRQMLLQIPKVLAKLEGVKSQRKTILEEIATVEAIENINPQAQVISGMPHGTGISKTTENEAMRLIFLRERYQTRLLKLTEEIEEYEQWLYRIERAMCWLSPEQTKVLRMRYWVGKSMIATALELNIAESYGWQLERQGIAILGEYL